MTPDERICYCYDVPLRKLWHFARRVRPRRASQMSECLGAGTGCGWCIPILKKIHARACQCGSDPATDGHDQPLETLIDVSPEAYAAQRRDYIDSGKPRNKF